MAEMKRQRGRSLSKILNDCTVEETAVLAVVQMLWVHSLVFASLSRNISREVSEFLKTLKEPFFVCVFKNALQVYWSPKKASKGNILVRSFSGAITAIISASEVLCVGSYPHSSSVYSVNFRTLAIREEPNMRQSRHGPGVLRVAYWVYVFGGSTAHGITKSAEKFATQPRQWFPLPDMEAAQFYFAPVLYKKDIFLVHTAAVPGRLSAFNIDTETFKQYSLLVPISAQSSIACVADGVLTIITTSQMWQYDIEAEKVTALVAISVNSIISKGEVRVADKKMYWQQYDARGLSAFDISHLGSRNK